MSKFGQRLLVYAGLGFLPFWPWFLPAWRRPTVGQSRER